MGQITDSKKLGIGSISLILSIFGATFSFTAWDGKELGGHLLNAIGISLPIRIISLVILFISFAIGYKYKNDYFAKSGRVISIIFILLIVVLSIISQLNFYFVG
jgi:hypothetical protein